MAGEPLVTGERTVVNVGYHDNRPGTVANVTSDGIYSVQLDNEGVRDCVFGRDGKLHPLNE